MGNLPKIRKHWWEYIEPTTQDRPSLNLHHSNILYDDYFDITAVCYDFLKKFPRIFSYFNS